MSAPSLDDFEHPIRKDILDAIGAFGNRVAGAGSWWTGAQRVEVAQRVRAARAVRGEPPWLRKGPAGDGGPLPHGANDVVDRVAIDAHRLDRAWGNGAAQALGDAAYVELVAVAACATAVDAFAEALGAAVPTLPAPRGGEPDRRRPDGLGDAGAWVPMTVPWSGPNVARALSLAPNDQQTFMGLVASMYAFTDFAVLIWDRPLSRPQVELVASRVSAVNECFY